MINRYEIRRLNNRFYVWDVTIRVWQTAKDTYDEAASWIADKLIDDAKPRSWIGFRMPLKD